MIMLIPDGKILIYLASDLTFELMVMGYVF
jgi:hypothetical protein